MNTSPKLQRACRSFLLRLVAENGTDEAADILRRLADEIEGFPETYSDDDVDLDSRRIYSGHT